jgi:hypothetical protein
LCQCCSWARFSACPVTEFCLFGSEKDSSSCATVCRRCLRTYPVCRTTANYRYPWIGNCSIYRRLRSVCWTDLCRDSCASACRRCLWTYPACRTIGNYRCLWIGNCSIYRHRHLVCRIVLCRSGWACCPASCRLANSRPRATDHGTNPC